MNDFVRILANKYRLRGLLIDTNILLLYFVGIYDKNWIAKFKRLQSLTEADFVILQRFVKFFSKVVTTPNILTEVNSFSNQLPENIKKDYFVTMKKQIAKLEESYKESRKICELAHFPKFGLTDTGIIELVRNEYLVLTDDFRLANYLEKLEIDVINFNHIRDI